MSLDLSPHQQAMLNEMGIKLWGQEPKNSAVTGATKLVAEKPTSERFNALKSTAKSVLAEDTTVKPEAFTPKPQAPHLAVAKSSTLGSVKPTALLPSHPQHQAIAAMDWETLEQNVTGCKACGLCQSRKQAVFGLGAKTARLMIVGEAPDASEDEQGEPFAGAAGSLLDEMLRSIGLSRETVYVTNALKCRPPANRNPSSEEVAQCASFLQRQIALLQPQVILGLGRFAAQSLLAGNAMANAPLGQLRGQVHPYSRQAHATPLILSYHPAYLLRSSTEKAKAWQGLLLVKQQLGQA